MIFGILGKFGIGIGHQKKPENVLVEKKIDQQKKIENLKTFRNFRNLKKFRNFQKSQNSKNFQNVKMLSFVQNFKKFRDFRDFRNFENFELFFLHDEKIFSIPIFFTDLDYVSRVPENYLEHSMTSSEEDIDRVWGAFS